MATKVKKIVEQKTSQDLEIEEVIRERAYLKWLATTNGTPVSDADTIQFWVEAEEEVKKDFF